jgi:hypothetical protein
MNDRTALSDPADVTLDPQIDATELADADLEHVVGGLARAWIEPAPADERVLIGPDL